MHMAATVPTHFCTVTFKRTQRNGPPISTINTFRIIEDARARFPGTISAKKWKPQLFAVVEGPDRSVKRIQAPIVIQNLLGAPDEWDRCFPLGCAATSH